MNTKSRLIYIPADGDEIQADLRIPEDSKAIVIFAHESGSAATVHETRMLPAF